MATGDFEAGQVIDMKDVGSDVKIDFSSQGNKVYASVTQEGDGTFSSVKYSASPPEVKKPN